MLQDIIIDVMHIVIDEGATSYFGIFIEGFFYGKVIYLTIITAPAKSVQPHLDSISSTKHDRISPTGRHLSIIALDTATFTGEVNSSQNSVPTNNNLFLSYFKIVF